MLMGFSPREPFSELHKNTTTGAKARVPRPSPNVALEGPLFHGGTIGVAEGRKSTSLPARSRHPHERMQ